MATIVLEGVSKRFGDVLVVDDVSLEVADGEFLVLLGPSGCGKTTTLRMVAGLEAVSDGIIRIGERETQDLHPADRDVAMVFQNYALYPHMSVYDNLAYGLRRRGLPKDRIDSQVRSTAELLQLQDYLKRRPAQLSGGQRQRVALGRAIVRHPSAFLMDEPLSNLDAKLRVEMRTELMRLHSDLRVTTMYVTHDQVEAMTMGHRIAVMDRGRVQQVGPPLELYRQPANIFVAGFLGTPEINRFEGTIERVEGKSWFRSDDARFEIPAAIPAEISGEHGGEIVVGVRPQEISVVEQDADAEGRTPLGSATLEFVEHLGPESFAVVKQGDRELIAEVDPDAHHQRGSAVSLTATTSTILYFDARTGTRIGGGTTSDALPRNLTRT